MPKYKVKEKGFYGGKIYDPKGKRPFLHVDRTLKPVPKWLEPMKAETAVQKKKRIAAEKRQTDADKKKKADDKKDIDNMTFMGDGEKAKSSAVETL